MYAIVEIAGQQFKVEKDQQIYVHRLDIKEGSKSDFEKVLLIDNGGKITVGAPVISGAKVTAKVLSHLKGDKVIVFKKKRRKGYKVKNGHRQFLTKLEILQIDEKTSSKKVSSNKIEKKSSDKKVSTKKTETKKATTKKATTKKATTKKATTKKATTKKATTKKTETKKATTKKAATKKTNS